MSKTDDTKTKIRKCKCSYINTFLNAMEEHITFIIVTITANTKEIDSRNKDNQKCAGTI